MILGPGGGGKTTLLRAIRAAHGEESTDDGARPEEPWRQGGLEVRVGPPLLVPQKPLPMDATSAQRLDLLRAAIDRDTSLLVLDEPEVGLDTDGLGELVRRLRERRAKGTPRTTVLATHNLLLAQAVADHVVLLIDGEIVEAGPAPQFFAAPRLERTRHFIRMGC